MAEISVLEAINRTLDQEMARDKFVFMLGEDIGQFGGSFGVTQGLVDKYPDRVIDTPISEMAIAGASVGASATGMRPVPELMFNDFLTVAMDQLVNQAAKMRYMFGGKVTLPFTLRIPAGAGIQAAAQHSQSLEAWMVHVPGLKVVMPSSPADHAGLLKASIRDDDPVIFFEHKLLYGVTDEVPDEVDPIPLGKADIKREGEDVTIIANSMMVYKALEAAEELASQGINAEVVDPRTLYPLDKETIINSVVKTNRVVIAHEAVKRSGIGAELSAIISEEALEYLDAPIKRVAALNVPIPFSPTLEDYVIPGKDDIKKAVQETME